MSKANLAEVKTERPVSLIEKIAQRFSMEPEKLLSTLKATAFKVKDGEATNEQMAALLIVSDQYGLNPFTKELFAFPDKKNGIVPVVSVDGWARIINDHGALNGIEFRYSEKTVELPGAKPCPEWCEVSISRKDRDKPIVVREYLDEVYRHPFKGQSGYEVVGPWQTHTKRFLRHKTLIQGARIAFGFSGIYDEDEAQRIIEMGDAEVVSKQPIAEPQRKSAPAAEVIPVQQSESSITESHIKFLRSKLFAEGISEADMFMTFGVEKYEDLKVSQVNEIAAWAKSHGK